MIAQYFFSPKLTQLSLIICLFIASCHGMEKAIPQNDASLLITTPEEKEKPQAEATVLKKKGELEVICGPMFAGKSEELLRRIRRAKLAKQKIVVFKNKIDTRSAEDQISSHIGNECEAIAIKNPADMKRHVTDDARMVAIDEVQFFGDTNHIVPVILAMINSGKKVIVAGLDLDFRGMPFGCVPTLMALANTVTKLHAVCMQCGKDAMYSQRLIDGRPAKFDDAIILIGAEDRYEARCRDCFVIDKSGWETTPDSKK